MEAEPWTGTEEALDAAWEQWQGRFVLPGQFVLTAPQDPGASSSLDLFMVMLTFAPGEFVPRSAQAVIPNYWLNSSGAAIELIYQGQSHGTTRAAHRGQLWRPQRPMFEKCGRKQAPDLAYFRQGDVLLGPFGLSPKGAVPDVLLNLVIQTPACGLGAIGAPVAAAGTAGPRAPESTSDSSGSASELGSESDLGSSSADSESSSEPDSVYSASDSGA